MHELTGRTHWHEPTGSDRAGFGEFGRPNTPYDLFMESEGIPIYRDIGVRKVQDLPLAPWKRIWRSTATSSSQLWPASTGPSSSSSIARADSAR